MGRRGCPTSHIITEFTMNGEDNTGSNHKNVWFLQQMGYLANNRECVCVWFFWGSSFSQTVLKVPAGLQRVTPHCTAGKHKGGLTPNTEPPLPKREMR